MEEKTQYWDINLQISPLSPADKTNVESFFCGEKELDSFFHNEIYVCAKHHYVAAYYAKDKRNGDIIALFTLANDSVVIDNVEDKEDFMSASRGRIDDEYVSVFERQTSFPAINIGHLGVRRDLQSQGIGGI